MKTVTHIIKSQSFDSDGRLQKWINSLMLNDIKSEVFFVEDDNKKKVRFVNDTKIESVPLFFRKYFKKRKGYIFKIPEYSMKTLQFLKKCDSDILIFHDVQQYLNLLIILFFSLFKEKQIVWDLHELPHPILFKYYFTRKVVKYILENVDVVVYTNNERRDYIYERLKMKENEFFILNNYPNDTYLNEPHSSLPKELKDLRYGLPYILWLGGALQGRNFTTFFEAYKNVSDIFNLVILGRVDDLYIDEVNDFINQEKVYNNFVKQEEMINYIDNAYFSVVLYKNTTPNNYYCEPNRLYQLITRNIPAIVGCNPTMKAIIEKYKAGLILKDDGSDLELMNNAFHTIIKSDTHTELITNMENSTIKDDLTWESQIIYIINKLKS